MKFFLSVLTALALLCIEHCNLYACTGLYVGSKCSVNGTTIIARSCDWELTTLMPYLRITEAVKNMPGRLVDGLNGFRYELPADTYRFISNPFPPVSDVGEFESFSINENGVAFSATVTGYVCEAACEADPLVPDGISEETLTSLAAPCAKSAREAIDILVRVMDRMGNLECNIVMVVDQKEAWYMEMYTGHQYCAIKMPDDMVAVFGNEFMIDTVDPNSDDVICSSGLFTLPQKGGFAVMDDNGRMNIRKTYMGDGRLIDFSHLRTWRGHSLLSPSTSGEYQTSEYYPLFFKPDKKVSVAEVMSIYRDRHEGTPFNPETSGCDQYRVIGDETQLEAHILEVYGNLPAPISCVAWFCTSEAAYSPFVPISNLVTDLSPYYKYCPMSWGLDLNAAQHIYKRLNAICANNRDLYGRAVKEYWATAEREMMDNFTFTFNEAVKIYESNPQRAEAMLTGFGVKVQNDFISDANRLFDEIMWHSMKYTRTNPYMWSLSDFSCTADPAPDFVPLYDVERRALSKGWSLTSGLKDGVLELSREGTVITISAGGPGRLSNGNVTVTRQDGTTDSKEYDVSLRDGRIYIPISEITLFD